MSGVLFRYTARTPDGTALRGAMAAPHADAVIAALRSRALIVTGVRGASRFPLTFDAAGPADRQRALVPFFRALAALARAGVPLRRALEVTAGRCAQPRFRETVRAVAADIEAGETLADALARRPDVFSALHVAMIRAGETSGALDDVLGRIATLVERDAQLRRTLRNALAYPAFVFLATAALLTFLLARVVPMFGEMFAAFHVEPPAPTRALLAVAGALRHPSTWAAAGIAAGFLATCGLTALASRRGAAAADRARLALPLVGPLLRKAVTARIARTLGTLLRSGVEVVSAVEAAIPVASSSTFAATLRGVAGALRAGDRLGDALDASPFFDPIVVALVRAGEESGSVDELLVAAASYLDADVQAGTAALAAVVEPLVLSVLGVAVGFVVFSVFLPLYALLGSVSS